jgi:hypothetical protein
MLKTIDPVLYDWLRAEPTITRYSLTSSLAYQQLCPADPMRFGIILNTVASANVVYSFDESSAHQEEFVTSQYWSVFYLTDHDIPGLITNSVWVKSTSGTPVIYATALSYNPSKRSVYDAIIRKYLSDIGTL